MERRRTPKNGTMMNDGSECVTMTAATPAENAMRNPMRFLLFAVTFCALYYTVNMTERNSLQRTTPRNASADSISTEHTIQMKATHSFILEPNNEFTPEICWLMSFPNSGTSYTMTMVARSSNRSFASNYGDEVTALDDAESLSIYPRRPEGPYWAGLSGKIASPRELPNKFVLTKTHCGSRCINCGPDEYIETPEVFLRKCASGHARVGPKRSRIDVAYPASRVKRAVHLIRNPFHNIIARFHLDHRHRLRSNKTDWAATHPNSKEGLHAWCHDLDVTYADLDKEYLNDYESLVRDVPCHGEFYKYTQWHNLVHEGLALIPHEVPTLTVYYEDYSVRFNETIKEVLDFLELEHVGILREFQARSDYAGYFSPEQERKAKKFVKSVASEKTWNQIKHYFDFD